MEKSSSIQNLTQSLAKFHAMVGRISKDAKNPFFKSNYASLPHIITEVSEPLEKAGLILSQFPNGDGLTTMLIHAESGEYISQPTRCKWLDRTTHKRKALQLVTPGVMPLQAF
jgi:hypothetical protein